MDAYRNSTRGIIPVARATTSMINSATNFAPGNGFCLSWPASAAMEDRVTAASGDLLANFSAAYARTAKRNGWPDLGGGGLEQIGAVAAIQMLLVRVVDGVLRLWPGWPAGARASFADLRVTGAFLVSANSAMSEVTIVSEAGLPLKLPRDIFAQTDISTAGRSLCANGVALALTDDGQHFWLRTVAGQRVTVAPCK